MSELHARNVNHAIVDGLWFMKMSPNRIEEDSRNGKVYVARSPVLTVYERPFERVLFWAPRDPNPFFHLMEAIWMMAGRRDSKYLDIYISDFGKRFAEDNGIVHGAYGYRWREYFINNQLLSVADILARDKTSRQVVLTMWDPYYDLGGKYRDIPCNTHIYFDRRNNVLNMTVCCRSNDIIWGAYGANAVHMSFLQECIANEIDIPVGVYRQFSNNYHLYVEPHGHLLEHVPTSPDFDPYYNGEVYPVTRILEPGTLAKFQDECNAFCDRKYGEIKNKFLVDVAAPMQEFYIARKKGDTIMELLSGMPSCDWQLAATDWVERRQ